MSYHFKNYYFVQYVVKQALSVFCISGLTSNQSNTFILKTRRLVAILKFTRSSRGSHARSSEGKRWKAVQTPVVIELCVKEVSQ